MGVFGKRKSAVAVRNDLIAKAVITPAVSTMVSDGNVSQVELAQLSNMCSFSPVYFEFSQQELERMILEIMHEISSVGHHGAIQRAAVSLSPALRETALCFAMRIALADGVIEEGEKESLLITAATLQVDVQRFQQIFEFVVMMQRPSNA